jgi:hypothetical protein
MFCPECKSMLKSSGGQLKCRKCGYVRKIQTADLTDTDQTNGFFCFCHRYRCPHKDYTLCPKNCEETGPMSRCKVKCQFARQHPEECAKIISKLQEDSGEKPKHIAGYKL